MPGIAIVGASGTIGRAVSRRLVQSGRRLLLLGRNESKLQELATELNQDYAAINLSDSQGLENSLREHLERYDGFDGIVNCVGSILLKPAHSTSDAEFRDVIETNLFSSFATIRAGARLLRERGGSIVLFGSAAAEIGIPNHEAIAAAKAGVIGMSRSAAATYAADNVRINVVSPGLVRTEMTRRIWENPASLKASTEMHALGRIGEPEQIASLVVWLLDPENDWITGQVIGVDGGLGHLVSRRKSSS